MIRHLLGAALLCVGASVAEAGVAGNSYTGLLTLANQNTGLSTASFDAETWLFSRQFIGDPQPVFEAGRFSETDLFVISIWEGSLTSTRGGVSRPVNGISIFSVVTTVNFPGPDENTPLASGIYISEDFSFPQPTAGAFAPQADTPFSGGVLASPRDYVRRTHCEAL